MSENMSGLVHLYVGDGKGKTTAALGLAVRALGAGKRVLMVQFLKGQQTSELKPLDKLGINVVRMESADKFVFQMNDEEKAAVAVECRKCLDIVKTAFADEIYDLVVLDEVVDAVNLKLISSDELVDIVKSRSSSTEVVLTGRNPDDNIVAVADYLTIMTALKHPYRHGVAGRVGIEY